MTTWFVSDLHFLHKNIVEYTKRGQETTQENHDSWLINLWNSQVKAGELVWHTGDFCFSRDVDEIEDILRKLNGVKHFIKGNHDDRKILTELKKRNAISWWGDYKEIKLGKQTAVLFHFPMAIWHKQHYGSIHLHGHCFDDKTQVLTIDGFKSKGEICVGDLVATVNNQTLQTEYQSVGEVHSYNNEQTIFTYEGKSVSLNITNNHRVLHRPYKETDRVYKTADNLKGNICIPVCGENSKEDYPISDDFLRLYFHICTDGSFENSNLVRFHLKKERKISALLELLERLDIKYSNNKQKSGTTKINFIKPAELQQFNVKPLDRKLVLGLSKRQVDILVDVYEKTDGCKTGKNSWQFSTAKECEANLLQECLVTSGYCCNLLKRQKGKYTSFVLSVNSRKESVINSKNLTKTVSVESTWCLTVPNSNLIVRRNGKVHVTGNSHGSYQPAEGKILDVGLDSAYNIFGEHKFFTEEDVLEYMQSRKIQVLDHHQQRQGEM